MTRFSVMFVGSVALAAIAACSNDWTELPGCQDCGHGAIKNGFFLETEYGPVPAVANRQGTVAVDALGEVWWFDSTLRPSGSKGFDQSVIDVSMADDDSVAVAIGSYFDEDFVDDHYKNASVVSLAPDRSKRWQVDIGTIPGASVFATRDIVVIESGGSMTALRASDGKLLWQKADWGTFAAAPDGTLVATGNTLSGGVYVAAFDPLTGDTRWQLQFPEARFPGAIAAGPNGEVAITWRLDTTIFADMLYMLDPAGNVKWSQSIRPPEGLATDGELVFAGSRPPAFSQYSATGIDWRQSITSDSVSCTASVLALAGDRLIGSISTDYLGDMDSTTTVGDVTYAGDGIAVVELAR